MRWIIRNIGIQLATMPSTKKLTIYRSMQFPGPKRAKPPVRALNHDIKERIKREHELIQKLIRDADTRGAIWGGFRGLLAPLSVWTEFEQAWEFTELSPRNLPQWKEIGEYLKLHLLFQLVLEFGGYSFTARVRPDLQDKWDREGRNPIDRIRRVTGKPLQRQGLQGLDYCYVVEGRTRRGRGRTPLHLHGFFVAEDPLIATRFKVAMEHSISVHRLGCGAAGTKSHSGVEVDIKPAYDVIDESYGDFWCMEAG